MKEDPQTLDGPRERLARAAFTLVELLLVIAIVGILAGGGFLVVQNVREGSRTTKLASDVATINRAIDVYTAHGGSLTGLTNPQDVLNQLKTAAVKDQAGFSGRAIDVRLVASAVPPAAGAERAVWDTASGRFVIATDGAGVSGFELDDALAANDFGRDDVRQVPIELASNDKWVWGFNDQQPLAPAAQTRPGRAGEGTTSTPGAPTAQKLSMPVFDPDPAAERSIFDFDMEITLTNPNLPGVSELVVVKGGTATLYTGGSIPVSAGETILAYARSIDPDHYRDSDMNSGLYTGDPFQLEVDVTVPPTVTWAQAGGPMAGGVVPEPVTGTASVSNVGQIPPAFADSSRFRIYYTLDGADLSQGGGLPGTEGPYAPTAISFAPANWTGTTASVRAIARAMDTMYFESSAVSDPQTVSIAPTALPAPAIDPPSGQKAVDLPVSVLVNEAAGYPANYRIFYTVDGSDPGNLNGNPVSGEYLAPGAQIASGAGENGTVVVTARIYGPEAHAHWFTPSPPAAATYSSITLADGALVGSAQLYGTFVGSLIYASPSGSGSMSNLQFTQGARILNGNLYLPGTPKIYSDWVGEPREWKPGRDSIFTHHILGWEFDAAGNKTVQTTPLVLNDNGNPLPDNYHLVMYNNSLVEGKIIRRHDAPPFPTIAPPPPPDSWGSVGVNGPWPTPISASVHSSVSLNTSSVGEVRLLPGNYNNLAAHNGSTFVLGDPDNPDVTQIYNLNSLQLTGASQIKVVGKVIVTIGGSIQINNGSTLGNPDHPEWFQLQLASGGLQVTSQSKVYGQIVAPSGTVDFHNGSIFRGSVTANSLIITSSSVIFNLPPVIEN